MTEDDNVIGKEGNAQGDMMVGEALQEPVFDHPLNQSVQDVNENHEEHQRQRVALAEYQITIMNNFEYEYNGINFVKHSPNVIN